MIGILGGTKRAMSGMALVLSFVLFVTVGAHAAETPGQREAEPTHASDHVLVKLEPGVAADGVLEETGERSLDGWIEVPVPTGKTAAEVAEELQDTPGVENAEVDPVVQLDPMWRLVPASHADPVSVDDPLLADQWHISVMELDAVWGEATGKGVVVAVVDTGVSKEGEDLDCHSFVSPYNAITGSSGASAATDDHGHGTHVAGTVAQCTNNGIGVAGVAFDAKLMPVKVLNSSGEGLLSNIAEGIEWARSHGADVINLSLGCTACQHPMVDEAIDAAVGAGVVIVAAAGNGGALSVLYPANHPDVIAVGATDYDNSRAPYSNGGPSLDLVAPGGDLDQDANSDGQPDGVLQETFCDSPPNACNPSVTGANGWDYYFMHGTSMATPHVSGAVALLLSAYPDATPDILRTALVETARDLGPAGFDNSYGHGLIQVHDALDFDLERPVWGDDAALLVERYGETSLKFSWGEASDNVSVTGYQLRLRGSDGLKVAARAATVTVLSPASPYVFEVLARDEVGNWSEPLVAVAQTAQAFTDTPGHIFYDDILWMSGTDVTRGCNPPANDRFCPDDPVTRAQAAAFLVRALGLSEIDHPGFVDVSGGSTFAMDILRLATAGISKGCNPPDNDRFCPDDPVTRAQAAAFLVRALGLSEIDHPGFVDVSGGSSLAMDIVKLATAGITRGCNPPDNDRFCPEELLTRGQWAALLHRALETRAFSYP